MSFKRADEDHEQLSVLKKRRVTELLSEDIPEDEALRTKNGRLCCLVCHNRPLFDTVDMLYLHRDGKKHKQNAESFYDKQRELQMLKEKRKHDAYIKTGSATLQQVASRESSGRFSLLPAKDQYNPCVKKKKLKPDQRRTIIQLDVGGEPVGTDKRKATPITLLPGYVKPYVSNRGFHQDGANGPGIYPQQPRARSAKLECPKTSNTAFQLGDNVGPIQKQLPTGLKHHPPKTIAEYRKVSKLKKQDTLVSPYSKKRFFSSEPLLNVSSNEQAKNVAIAQDPRVAGKSERKRPKRRANPGLGEKDKVTVSVLGPEASSEEERKRKAALYLQARGSGWKLDWSGQKWIRDEEAEFDSDEEPPKL